VAPKVSNSPVGCHPHRALATLFRRPITSYLATRADSSRPLAPISNRYCCGNDWSGWMRSRQPNVIVSSDAVDECSITNAKLLACRPDARFGPHFARGAHTSSQGRLDLEVSQSSQHQRDRGIVALQAELHEWVHHQGKDERRTSRVLRLYYSFSKTTINGPMTPMRRSVEA